MLRKNKLHKDKHAVILVVNNEELLLQEELVQDIISIFCVFSCRLYGFRKYKNLKEGELTQRANIQKRKRYS